VIELYAITDDPGPPLPDVEGLRLVPFDGLAAVCTPASEGELSPETLWHHEDVVEALMADRDLLPVRYGTRLDDETAVARAMEGRRDELAAALERVRGAVELSVRVVAGGAPAPSPPRPAERTSGAEYLRLRAEAEASSDEAARALGDPLAALARESAQAPPRPPELFRAAYLVERGAIDSFVAEVGRLQGESPGLAILCTGPWPPYSFAAR
jgi:Gas vesicle synthesis protein GvpL/GvpF